MVSYKIEIEGFIDPKSFVEKWSGLYSYGQEKKYKENISKVFFNEQRYFNAIFQWKNGTGDNISRAKQTKVDSYYVSINILQKLKEKFDWETFENEFKPSSGSNIWTIFLLHLVDPSNFPIYDQHVYRFYHFHTKGVIDEIPTNAEKRYKFYKEIYQPWFNEIKENYNLDPKKMDEAFFTYGQQLKKLIGKGIKITRFNNTK